MQGNFQEAVAESKAALYKAMADLSIADESCMRAFALDTTWSIAWDTLDFLARLMNRMKPRHILEFGSGVSTIFMALNCRSLSLDCLITSIDHDPKFARSTEQQLEKLGERIETKFYLAPLVVRDFGGKLLPAYFLEESEIFEFATADLVLIDGPPLLLGGREGVLYQAMQYFRPGTVILLDDANRTHELETLSKWQDNLGEAIEVHRLQNFQKGLAAIIVRQPVAKQELWSHRLSITSKEIENLIPKQSRVILVDEMRWTGGLDADIQVIPFLEHEGEYWGVPSNDQVAVSELDRLRAQGAEFLIFGWPAFWWLSHYRNFHDYLIVTFQCLLENDRLVVFDLRQ